MEDNSAAGGTALLNSIVSAGAQEVGKNIGSRTIDAICSFIKKAYGRRMVDFKRVFAEYLGSAQRRYNEIKTIATGNQPREIMGADSIYVHTHLEFEGEKISTVEVDGILALSRSKHVLIEGTGGAGKTMLMRYLLLKAIQDDNYIPILLNLRQISNQNPESLSILNLIYTSLDDLGCKLQGDQFEYSLQSGKYLFLMDGFDEVKESMAAQAAVEIQKFCAKYPNNPCIVTSRPRDEFSRFETFAVAETIPLSKEQAIDLASRLWPKDEKTKEFCRQLDAELFDKHKDFAENPLLLTMLFLTFMENNTIPDHLVEFYYRAFDALYRMHDSKHKDTYVREFRCTGLSETEFKKLLSRFCFQSLMKQEYEFSEEKVLNYLENSIQRLSLNTICAQDFLQDLVNAVCILVKEGRTWRFSHRSFQSYFAACYAASLSDEQQKKIAESFMEKLRYYREFAMLLFQINPLRFVENYCEKTLRDAVTAMEYNNGRYSAIIKQMYHGLLVSRYGGGTLVVSWGPISGSAEVLYLLVGIFSCGMYRAEATTGIVRDFLENTSGMVLHKRRIFGGKCIVSFDDIDGMTDILDEDREGFYERLAIACGCDKLYAGIRKLLAQLDAEREALTKPNFLEEL